MDDFLLVMPPEWQEVPNATAFINGLTGEAQMNEYITSSDWVGMTQVFWNSEHLSESLKIINARMFNTGSVEEEYLRLWILTVPVE